MPQVNQWSLQTAINNIVVAAQAKANVLIDFTVGSVNLALIEAVAQVVIWLEGLILILLATTRAATSNGSDLDTWMADYGLTRLAATSSSGQVTFSRFTPTYQAVVPVGAIVQTADGTQQFTVVADSTQTAYNATLNGYVIPAGTTSAVATVNAVNTGTQTNVLANTITTLTQAVQYVDTVANAAGYTNGANAESDSAFRIRFIGYLASLAKATPAAIKYALSVIQSGVTYSLTENKDYNGTADNGYFYAIVDDGTGAPSSTFITTATAAVEAVRPIGIRYGVFGPADVLANVSMTITTAAGYTHSSVVGSVVSALQTYINTLGVGNPLPYTQLANVAYNALPGAVTNVSGVLLNSGTSDLTATAQQIIRSGTLGVT
ncbi:MAG TPA: baseplate J/gp47 family protein [Terriglobales bacterium]